MMHSNKIDEIYSFPADIPFKKMAPGEACPSGTEITTESRCREAEQWKSELGLNPQRDFQSGLWQGLPLYCAAQCCGGTQYADDTFHFNQLLETDNSRQSEFARICEN